MRKRIRADRDFYRTPLKAVNLAKPLINSELNWWEPCAGDGAISKNIKEITYASDIFPMHETIHQLDMLNCDKPQNIDAVITNPPFCFQFELLDRCLYEWRIPALLLLRLESFSGQKRNYYTKNLLKMHIISSLIKFETEDGRIVNGNGTLRCAWCLFVPEKVPFTETRWVVY